MSQEKSSIKITVVGGAKVGKTALVNYWSSVTPLPLDETYTQTIGVQFKTKEITFNQRVFEFTFWDTAGQEEFLSLSAIYSRDASAIILACDGTRESFRGLQAYVEEIGRKHCHKIFLIRSKSDVNADITDQQLEIFAQEQGLVWAGRYSATEGTAPDDLFKTIIQAGATQPSPSSHIQIVTEQKSSVSANTDTLFTPSCPSRKTTPGLIAGGGFAIMVTGIILGVTTACILTGGILAIVGLSLFAAAALYACLTHSCETQGNKGYSPAPW